MVVFSQISGGLLAQTTSKLTIRASELVANSYQQPTAEDRATRPIGTMGTASMIFALGFGFVVRVKG